MAHSSERTTGAPVPSSLLTLAVRSAFISRKETSRCFHSSQSTSRTDLRLCRSVTRPTLPSSGWSRSTSGRR